MIYETKDREGARVRVCGDHFERVNGAFACDRFFPIWRAATRCLLQEEQVRCDFCESQDRALALGQV